MKIICVCVHALICMYIYARMQNLYILRYKLTDGCDAMWIYVCVCMHGKCMYI